MAEKKNTTVKKSTPKKSKTVTEVVNNNVDVTMNQEEPLNIEETQSEGKQTDTADNSTIDSDNSFDEIMNNEDKVEKSSKIEKRRVVTTCMGISYD